MEENKKREKGVEFVVVGKFTCLSPGTSVTGLPSALIHRISGRGLPVAAHSTTVPVVFEKSMRLAGSFKKTGPDSEELAAAVATEPESPLHAPNPSKRKSHVSYRCQSTKPAGHHSDHHLSKIIKTKRNIVVQQPGGGPVRSTTTTKDSSSTGNGNLTTFSSFKLVDPFYYLGTKRNILPMKKVIFPLISTHFNNNKMFFIFF